MGTVAAVGLYVASTTGACNYAVDKTFKNESTRTQVKQYTGAYERSVEKTVSYMRNLKK